MADRLAGIEVFIRAIATGSLSAAGRDMGMSPAMAAKHLDALESRLGTTLVRRTTRKLSLTEAGRAFHATAERLLAELAEAEAEASASTVEIGGLLRVSAPVSFGTRYIAPLLEDFLSAHPGLAIELGLNDRLVDLLEEGWDVGIRIGRLDDSSLIARKLAPARLTLCAAPSYLARRGMPGTLDDIADHTCLGYTIAPLTGAQTWGFGSDGEIKIPVRTSVSANNGDALLAAAISGLGLLYGPRFIAAAALEDGRLMPIDLDVPVANLGAIYAVTHPDRRPMAKTRSWIEYLAKFFKGAGDIF